MDIKFEDRKEGGQLFRWIPEYLIWCSTSGRAVLVCPPIPYGTPYACTYWRVLVPSTSRSENFEGEEAGGRAFCIAEAYTRQLD